MIGPLAAVHPRVPEARLRTSARLLYLDVSGPGRDTVPKRARRALTALRAAGYTASLSAKEYGVVEIRKPRRSR